MRARIKSAGPISLQAEIQNPCDGPQAALNMGHEQFLAKDDPGLAVRVLTSGSGIQGSDSGRCCFHRVRSRCICFGSGFCGLEVVRSASGLQA